MNPDIQENACICDEDPRNASILPLFRLIMPSVENKETLRLYLNLQEITLRQECALATIFERFF